MGEDLPKQIQDIRRKVLIPAKKISRRQPTLESHCSDTSSPNTSGERNAEKPVINQQDDAAEVTRKVSSSSRQDQ